MKRVVVVFLFLLTSYIAVAQDAPLADTALVEAQSSLKVKPFYGVGPSTFEQLKEENAFLITSDKSFKTREEAGQFFSSRGWDYLRDGNLDTARNRFNLSQLLDDQNPEAYWGLGVVAFQYEKLDEASRYLELATSLDTGNVPLAVDLSTVMLRKFEIREDSSKLDEADKLLRDAAAKDSTYAQTFYNLALSSYYKSDFPSAWKFLHQGRRLSMSVLNMDLVTLLLEKMPDPEKFFKNEAPLQEQQPSQEPKQ